MCAVYLGSAQGHLTTSLAVQEIHMRRGPSHRDPCVSCPNATKKMSSGLCWGSSELYLGGFRNLLCFQSKPTSSGSFALEEPA